MICKAIILAFRSQGVNTLVMTLLIIHLLVHHQFAMTSNILSSSHPYNSYLQTVHHAIVGAMVRLLTERELSLPSSNLVPIVGMSGPDQVNHALEILQLVIYCYQPASCTVSNPWKSTEDDESYAGGLHQ